MKLPCKVIEDILPMYYDSVCSKESASLIEEHLKDCTNCRNILSQLQDDISIPQKNVDDIKPLKKIQKRYKKKRVYWLVTIIVVLLLVPMAFIIGSKHNTPFVEYTEEEALTYTNEYMTALSDGNYENAFSYWDIEAKKHEWMGGKDFEENDLKNIENDGMKKFCEMGENLEELGRIKSFECITISDNGYDYRGDKKYSILYNINFGEKDETFRVDVTKNGVHSISAANELIEHPLSQLCLWGQWLYDDYLGRYYDYDLKEYIYYDKQP